MKDGLRLKTKWVIDKFTDPEDIVSTQLKAGKNIDELMYAHVGREEIDGNLALNEGLQLLIDIIAGISTPTLWDAGNANIGVGNDNTAAQASDTGLIGGSTDYNAMDSTYPQRSSQDAIWRATYGSSEANFAWEEYTVCNGTSNAGVNLNRKVENKGTKVSGETWTITLTITFS